MNDRLIVGCVVYTKYRTSSGIVTKVTDKEFSVLWDETYDKSDPLYYSEDKTLTYSLQYFGKWIVK